MSTEVRRTVCNRDCPDACGILATVSDGRVTSLSGDPDHPITRGFLCPRTTRVHERQYAPDRVLRPLVRESLDRDFRPAAWDEALDLVAGRLEGIRRESGGAAILHYRCGGSLGLLTEVPDLFFARFGPVTTKRGDVCGGAGEAAQEADFGVSDASDLDEVRRARTVILWGKNCATSSPHTLSVVRDARANGAQVVLIDPVRHKTAEVADRFVQPRPGGDLPLAMAVAALLFEEGLADPAASSWCEGIEAFRDLARSRTVEAWCRDADVPIEAAEDLARRLGSERPVTILLGWGLVRRLHGAATVRAIDALGLVTGNVGVPGAGVSFFWRRRTAFDLSVLKGPQAPRTVREALLGSDVLAASDPPIRAAWITAGNPVAMLPDSERVSTALRTREFVVVADAFLTDTARCAHVVLPTRTLLESDDILGAYGHHYLSASRPVVPPQGEARSDLEIVQGLALRLGLGDAFAGSHREWKQRLVGPRLRAAGVTLDALEAGAVRNPFAPRVAFEGRRFPTPSGKARLTSSAPAIEPADPGYPMVLMSLPMPGRQGSQWSVHPEGPAEVRVHPDASRGVPDGGLARLQSRIGELIVRVRFDPGQRRDVAILPKGGWLSDGQCANGLVRARLTDEGEGAAFYDEGVRLLPV